MIDRFYFRSIYFREPSGVLFEIATLGPGLHARTSRWRPSARSSSLPPDYEHLREQIEATVTPIVNPRAAAASTGLSARRRAATAATAELTRCSIREPAGEPEGALVLLHGRGVDENDLFPLLDALDPERRLLGRHARARR